MNKDLIISLLIVGFMLGMFSLTMLILHIKWNKEEQEVITYENKVKKYFSKLKKEEIKKLIKNIEPGFYLPILTNNNYIIKTIDNIIRFDEYNECKVNITYFDKEKKEIKKLYNVSYTYVDLYKYI